MKKSHCEYSKPMRTYYETSNDNLSPKNYGCLLRKRVISNYLIIESDIFLS